MEPASRFVDLVRRILATVKPGDSSKSILPFVPRPLKWLFVFILILNHRGLPFSWHVRVFKPAIYARFIHGIRNLSENPAKRQARLARLAPVGLDPFTSVTVFKTRATPDACDFNMHLSNSSYAMTYDMARFQYVVEHFPLVYRDGGWIALGATYYDFTREIPLNSPYEIRLSIAAWDNKWFYVVAKFVTYPSNTSPKSLLLNGSPPGDGTPAGSGTSTPLHSSQPKPSSPGAPLPPGAVLHCTAISKLCCKIGRITIPPTVAIGSTGFALSSAQFLKVHSWRFGDGGKRIKDFYKGGWRNVPESERWWEGALSGEMEIKRAAGLEGLAASVGLPVTHA